VVSFWNERKSEKTFGNGPTCAVGTQLNTLKNSKDLQCLPCVHSKGGGIAAEGRSQAGVAHDDGLRRSIIMNKTTALPAHPLPNSNLTTKSDTPSTTTASPNRFRQDRPRRVSPTADWTAVKVLTLDEMCDRYIRWMLNRCGGNRGATAEFLGIGRTSLYRYLKKADREKRDSATGNQLRG